MKSLHWVVAFVGMRRHFKMKNFTLLSNKKKELKKVIQVNFKEFLIYSTKTKVVSFDLSASKHLKVFFLSFLRLNICTFSTLFSYVFVVINKEEIVSNISLNFCDFKSSSSTRQISEGDVPHN